jgi:hypothetical protein
VIYLLGQLSSLALLEGRGSRFYRRLGDVVLLGQAVEHMRAGLLGAAFRNRKIVPIWAAGMIEHFDKQALLTYR